MFDAALLCTMYKYCVYILQVYRQTILNVDSEDYTILVFKYFLVPLPCWNHDLTQTELKSRFTGLSVS